jgi:SAM-dependent methyltransferase
MTDAPSPEPVPSAGNPGVAAPFVDFYRKYDISPVSQDISDLALHFGRRRGLYRQIGLPPGLLKGRSILEFGPGSGHNSLFTAHCQPSRYVLVDANDRALADLRENLTEHLEGRSGVSLEIVAAMFEDYRSDELFDVVLAEGCLPFQHAPAEMLSQLAQWVAPGGILVTTTVSATSYFPEVIRRLFRCRLIAPDAPPAEQLDVMRPLIGPHYAQLPSSTRPLDEYMLDNIVHPLTGNFLPTDEAIEELAGEFDLYGASPLFFTDLRWYKDIREPDLARGHQAIEQYHGNAVNFLDHRRSSPHDPGVGREIEARCRRLWDEMRALEASGDCPNADFEDALSIIDEVGTLVAPLSSETAAAIHEAHSALRHGGIDALGATPRFAALWGRGQSYLSFIRRGGR